MYKQSKANHSALITIEQPTNNFTDWLYYHFPYSVIGVSVGGFLCLLVALRLLFWIVGVSI